MEIISKGVLHEGFFCTYCEMHQRFAKNMTWFLFVAMIIFLTLIQPGKAALEPPGLVTVLACLTYRG